MGYRHYFLLCATLASFLVVVVQSGALVQSPATRFTCQGRASGYYADVETGCQVYHMCDGLGRQFSYSCPNTTLFQQRMLVCDHWYMVNCTNSESDYDANLLIGQRDKPFVSEADMRQRTPRPDILTVPPNSNYYDGLKEAETKFPFHPDNSIVGISESISSGGDNDLDSDKRNYRPPTSWSMKTKRPAPANIDTNEDSFKFNNRKPKRTETVTNIDTNDKHFKNVINERPTFKPSYKDTSTKKEIIPKQVAPEQAFEPNKFKPNVKIPSKVLLAPLPPTSDSQEYDIDARLKTQDPVYNFIKRFDPNSPDSIKTSMTRTEIIDLNKHLPDAQVSSEEDRLPRNNKNFGDNFNVLQSDKKKKGFTDGTRFETVNIKSEPELNTESKDNSVAEPARELLPPKSEMTPFVSTTMGPPIYYEWKWAVPAFDLEPPKFSNETNTNDTNPVKQVKRPFSDHTTTTPKPVDIQPMNTEYNTSSYFIPDFVFPLDRPHPGYDDESAQTSFQVEVSRPGRASYGENPACPHCHPAYLTPGTCEPCIVKR